MTVREMTGWVVYRHPADGATPGAMGVCRAAEWGVLDAARPGQLTLVRDGIASEGMAERLARGTTGDDVPRASAVSRWGQAGRNRPGAPGAGPSAVPMPDQPAQV